jgi:hypothetical protein
MAMFPVTSFHHMVEPLYLDERLEQRERSRVVHVLGRFIKSIFPFVYYVGPPRSRKSIEAQLRRRLCFPTELWAPYGPASEVVAVLKIIQKEFSLPNYNFIPSDPLELIMNCGYDNDGIYTLLALEKNYGVTYRNEETARISNEILTIGQFVNDFFERRRK